MFPFLKTDALQGIAQWKIDLKNIEVANSVGSGQRS
jgi:hypothetical protein